MSYVRIIEGRINVPKFIEKQLQSYIKKIAEEKIIIPIRKYYYTICNLKEDNGILFGEVVKMASSLKETYFDEKTWNLVEEEIEKRHVKIFNRFILYDDRTIILEDSYFLSRTAFTKALQNLLTEVIKEETPVFSISITFKKSMVDVLQFINKYPKIRKVTFTGLHSPNPIKNLYNDKKMKAAFEFIERTNVKNLTLESEDGLNIEADEIQGAIANVSEGIGTDAKITGISSDGSSDVYEVRSKLKESRVQIEDDEDFIKAAEKLKKKK